MLTQLTHAQVWVTDQDEALRRDAHAAGRRAGAQGAAQHGLGSPVSAHDVERDANFIRHGSLLAALAAAPAARSSGIDARRRR